MEPTLPYILEFVYAWIACTPRAEFPDGKRIIGVTRLTGEILEQRVALEACA